jgi:hypothetical protein
MIFCTASVSRQDLIQSETSSWNFSDCLVLFAIIIANILSGSFLCAIFYALEKYKVIDNKSGSTEILKFISLLIQQVLFTFLMLWNIPVVGQLSFTFSWIVFGITICLICLEGFSLIIIRKMQVFSEGLFDLLKSFTYTQYTLAVIMIFYKNYSNYNSSTRYLTDSESYKRSMANNISIWSQETATVKKNNLSNELKLKKQVNNWIYNINNLPISNSKIVDSISEQQNSVANVLKESESLLLSLQSKKLELSNSKISPEKLAFYNSNALFFNDYLSYTNNTNPNNALNQISYFLASFSTAEIVALINLQNLQFSDLLKNFLNVQEMMNSIQDYSPKTNSQALFDYLKFQNSVFYTNKLSCNIDYNILFSAVNDVSYDSLVIRDTLTDFNTCNAFQISRQNGFDYVIKNDNSCGVAFSIGNLYFICLKMNGLKYCIVSQNEKIHLIFSETGWVLNIKNYFQLLDIIQSSITTASPIILSDNNANYALKEDYAFSQGIQVSNSLLSSFSNFVSTLGNISWNFNEAPNFKLNDSGIEISFYQNKISINSGSSASPVITFAFSGNDFTLTNGSITFSGNCSSLSS